MQPAKIAELLEPFLGPQDLGTNTKDLFERISTYIDILLRWNARINLTAIRDPEEIVTRHFGESLFAAHHLFPKHAGTDAFVRPAEQSSAVADLGSGAGFPGIPIKLWAPEISLALIESNHKKATFLREVARALTLTDIDVQNTRAENVRARFDVVTLRAVERFDEILPTAVSLLAPRGRLALLIGENQIGAAQNLAPTLSWHPPIPIPQSKSRVLLVGRAE